MPNMTLASPLQKSLCNVSLTLCREFGKKLFMDADRLTVATSWGSFTDPAYINSGPLSPMKGKFAFIWAGAVLHVLTAADVRAFIKHVHGMLAPGGTFFGVMLTECCCSKATSLILLAFSLGCTPDRI